MVSGIEDYEEKNRNKDLACCLCLPFAFFPHCFSMVLLAVLSIQNQITIDQFDTFYCIQRKSTI